MKNDLTRGSVFTALLKFSVPLIISGLLQQLYNIADSIIVGNFVGESALAATGASAPIINVFIFMLSGLVSGCTILVSHAYGAGNKDKINSIATSFTYFIAAASLIVTVVGLVIQRPILQLLNTPQELMQGASTYLLIIFLGVPFMAFYNLAGAILRGCGNSRAPLVAIVIASVINVGLDLLFVCVFAMGIAGAAIATVIAQVFSAIYLFYYLKKDTSVFTFSLSRKSLDKPTLKEGLRLSFPRVIQSCVSSMGSFLLQNVMNSFGMATIAAISTAYKIDSLAILPILNLSVAISVFAGQNIGSGNKQRAQECLHKGLILTCGISAIITAIFVTCGFYFIKLFGVSDAVATLGQRFFYFAAAFYPVFGLSEGISGFLQGSKDVNFVAKANISGLCLRLVLSYALYKSVGGDIIAISEISAWSFTAVLFTVRYKSGKWKNFTADHKSA